MQRANRSLIPALLLLGGFTLLAFYAWTRGQESLPPTPPVAVVLPGHTITAVATESRAIASSTPTASVAAIATPLPLAPPTVAPETFAPTYRQRFGVTGFAEDINAVLDLGLPLASYADWNVRANPARPQDVFFWQMIRLRDGEVHTPREDIDRALAANPGATWLIGNEPDVVVQDNTTAQRYAQLYHELYIYIKSHDPAAKVAIGGVSQPTPLRRAYLDIVLDTYEETFGERMPIDVWNVHAFTLREEEGEWGIGIPPGMDDDLAIHYEIRDHGNLDIFADNLVDFREWMARRGYADRPLLVSEFGFLMPYDFGFTEQDVVTFLDGSFDFLLNARNDTGFAPDDGRLVQWWLWFIVSAGDDEFATSFLYNRDVGQLTDLGEAYGAFVHAGERDQAP